MEDKLAKVFNLMRDNVGDGVTLHAADDLTVASHVPYGVSSGIPMLDWCLGKKGGYPAGKVIELYGPPFSGKSTAALHAISQWQKLGGAALLIDTEHTYDMKRAESLGVDMNSLVVVSADSIEGVFREVENALDQLEKTGWDKPFLIVVDSITGVASEDEVKKSMGDEARVGQDARAIRRGLRRCNSRFARLNFNFIFVNHSIAKIVTFGKTTTSAGGHAIKFYAFVRLEFKPVGKIKENKDTRAGQTIEILIEKFKGGSLKTDKFRVPLLDAVGFDNKASLLDLMLATGMVTQAGRFCKIMIEEELVQFSKGEWSEILETKLGGFDAAYKLWKDWAVENGELNPWGG